MDRQLTWSGCSCFLSKDQASSFSRGLTRCWCRGACICWGRCADLVVTRTRLPGSFLLAFLTGTLSTWFQASWLHTSSITSRNLPVDMVLMRVSVSVLLSCFPPWSPPAFSIAVLSSSTTSNCWVMLSHIFVLKCSWMVASLKIFWARVVLPMPPAPMIDTTLMLWLWRTGNGDQRGGWMGASNFFRNLQPLSQHQSPKTIHERLDDHDPREGWMLPQNTAGHHRANGPQIEAQTSKLPK